MVFENFIKLRPYLILIIRFNLLLWGAIVISYVNFGLLVDKFIIIKPSSHFFYISYLGDLYCVVNIQAIAIRTGQAFSVPCHSHTKRYRERNSYQKGEISKYIRDLNSSFFSTYCLGYLIVLDIT